MNITAVQQNICTIFCHYPTTTNYNYIYFLTCRGNRIGFREQLSPLCKVPSRQRTWKPLLLWYRNRSNLNFIPRSLYNALLQC